MSLSPDEISAYAAKGEMPKDAMHHIDWVLWYTLRDIYNEFREGTLDKETGAKRKQHAVDLFNQAWEKQCRSDELCYRMAELWKQIEQAATEYRKSRTVENADKLMEIVYGFV